MTTPTPTVTPPPVEAEGVIDRLLAAVDSLVTAHPDAVYRFGDHPDAPIGSEAPEIAADCSYVTGWVLEPGQEPRVDGCLFGQALMDAGLVTRQVLAEDETRLGSAAVSQVLERLLGYDRRGADESPLTRALDDTQIRQDGGAPWVQAIDPLRPYIRAHRGHVDLDPNRGA